MIGEYAPAATGERTVQHSLIPNPAFLVATTHESLAGNEVTGTYSLGDVRVLKHLSCALEGHLGLDIARHIGAPTLPGGLFTQ